MKIVKIKIRKCRVCGCTNYRACPGGCFWVEPDLCSRCADKIKNKEVEPIRHAHWIHTPNCWIICSNCKKGIETLAGIKSLYLTKYCPHCGALMDENENNVNG